MIQKIYVLLGYIQNKYSSYDYIRETNLKFLINIDSYIDVLAKYVSLENSFGK